MIEAGGDLFNVFINDLATNERIHCLGVMISSSRVVGSLLYADDTSLMSYCRDMAQEQLDVMCEWSHRWGLIIHPDKTEVLLIRSRKSKLVKPTALLLNGTQPLRFCDKFKYLGVLFGSKTRTTGLLCLEKAEKKWQLLQPLLSKYGHLSAFFQGLLFKAVLRPTLTYGCEIFPVRSVYELFQKKVGRRICGAYENTETRMVYRTLGWSRLSTHVDSLCVRFAIRALGSEYELARVSAVQQLELGLRWGRRVLEILSRLGISVEVNDEESISCGLFLALEKLEEGEIAYWQASSSSLPELESISNIPSRLVRSGKDLVRFGFQVILNRYNPRDVEERVPGGVRCWMCQEGADTPEHVLLLFPRFFNVTAGVTH